MWCIHVCISAFFTEVILSNKMASDSKIASKAPDPAGITTTSLPRRLLSHRWVITDAKILLGKNGGQRLKSPNFSVVLPKKSSSGDTQQQTTLWFLRVYKEGEHLYMGLYQGSREAMEKTSSGDPR